MANDKPAQPDRRRGFRTELAVVALYSTGYALGHFVMLLARQLFAPTAQ